MDINKYKFYVRDIGISDTDLQMVLEDIIKDIALSTRIFKREFNITIKQDVVNYNIKEIFNSLQASNNLPLDIYIETLDILKKEYDFNNSQFISIFNLFEPISNEEFRFIGFINSDINAKCIINVIPNINSITQELEEILKPVIIEGIKYYSDTSLSTQDVNASISSYRKYQNAKLELQNKFNVYGTTRQQRRIIDGL